MMLKLLYDDAKVTAIFRVFSENSQAKNLRNKTKIFYKSPLNLSTIPCLTHSHTMTLFDTLNKPFENTLGKGKIARNEQFLIFLQCFLPIWITYCHFCQL